MEASIINLSGCEIVNIFIKQSIPTADFASLQFYSKQNNNKKISYSLVTQLLDLKKSYIRLVKKVSGLVNDSSSVKDKKRKKKCNITAYMCII